MNQAMSLEPGGVLTIPFESAPQRNTFYFYLTASRKGLGEAGEIFSVLKFRKVDIEEKGKPVVYAAEIRKKESVTLEYTMTQPDGTVSEGAIGTVFRERTIRKLIASGLSREEIVRYLRVIGPEEDALLDELFYEFSEKTQ